MKKDITELFIFVDDFSNAVDRYMKQHLFANPLKTKKTREPGLTHSEILTIVLLYQQSPCKNFKFFYLSYLQ